MSKSQGNIINPYDVFDTVGADPLRWYFLARVAPDAQKRISVDIIADVAGTFVNTLWNAYAFFVLYANLDRVDMARDVPVARRPEIDRWALALLQRTVETATRAMDAYDTKTAGEAIEAFVDQLSNWYIRRNRRRFWKSEAGPDKQAAYRTLFECLLAVTRLIAPFMPFLAEAIHRNLARAAGSEAPLSVHMEPWPEPRRELRDEKLLADVDVVQRVVSLGRAARGSAAIRTRQPLPAALVRVPDKSAEAALRAHEEQVLDELNVKALSFIARDDELVRYRVKPNLPRIGKRLGKLIPAIREALMSADAAAIAAAVARQQGFELDVAGQRIDFGPEDVLIESASAEGYVSSREEGYLVALDTRITDDLRREGLARELVRTIQEARKQAGLQVSDRIRLRVSGSAGVQSVLAESRFRSYVGEETLTAEWAANGFEPHHTADESLDNETWRIELAVAG
jgi:isoleucyl-tRNA synthetase